VPIADVDLRHGLDLGGPLDSPAHRHQGWLLNMHLICRDVLDQAFTDPSGLTLSSLLPHTVLSAASARDDPTVDVFRRPLLPYHHSNFLPRFF